MNLQEITKKEFRAYIAKSRPLELIDICARIKQTELSDYDRRYFMRVIRFYAKRLGVRGIV